MRARPSRRHRGRCCLPRRSWPAEPWALRRPAAAIAIGLALPAVVLGRRRARGGPALARAVALVSWLAVLSARGAGRRHGAGADREWPSLQSLVETVGAPLNPAYLEGVGEQAATVTAKGDLPDVRIYRDTLPGLYSLRELARWGLGPLLLVAALGGVVGAAGACCGGRSAGWARRHPGGGAARDHATWIVPTAIRFATFEVKYLRYFEPLVVAAVMVAAWGLLRLPTPWRRPAVAITVAGTALGAGMYLWAFAAPHPHRTAASGWARWWLMTRSSRSSTGTRR